jgi:hypothetical protein
MTTVGRNSDCLPNLDLTTDTSGGAQMAIKILIDNQDFVLLNAVKIHMSIEGLSSEQYIQKLIENSQDALVDVFRSFQPNQETVLSLSRIRKQTDTSNGVTVARIQQNVGSSI